MISWLSCGLVLAFVAGPLSVSSRSYSNGLIFYELKSHQPYLPPTVSVSRGRNLASVKYSDKGSIWSTFGQPCECRGPVCGCCAGLKVDQYRFDQKVCANVTFVPHLEEAQLEMYVNEKATSKFGLSVRNPAPFCIPVMMGVPMAMCVQMTDVQMVDNRLSMCMDFVVRLATTDLFEMHFQCMRMGLDGLQYVDKNGKPVLPPGQQGNDDDDAGEEYGEYAELENEPEEYPLAEDQAEEKEKPKPAPAQDYQPVAYPSLAYQPQVDDSEKTPSEDESLAYQPPKMTEKEPEEEEEEPEPLPIESEMLIAGDQVEEPEENDEELEDEAEAEEAKKETEKEVEKEKEQVEATPDNDNGSESGPGPTQVIETITNSIKAIEEMPATTTTIKATTAPTTTTTTTSKMETTNNKPNNVVIDDKDQEVSSKQEEAPAEREKEKEEVKMSSEEEETEDEEEEEEVEEDEEDVGEESTTTEAVELENDSDNEVNVDDDDADGGAKKGQVKEPPTKAGLEEKREPEKETSAAAGNELKVIKPGSAPNAEAGEDQETEEGAEEEEAAEEGTDEDTEDDEEEEYEDDEENVQNLDEKKAEKLVVEADQPLEGNEYQYNLENLENRDAKLAAKSAVTRSKAAKSLYRHGRQRLQRRPLKKRH
ncbi:myb-like protein X [Drosophila bipectinata]|uniref:myb-like protein X n=1 Tax=Drosophila bipectinata TaxID=42026 RepID=UPI001C8AAB4B|nr:glutamic acid-rich protein [Drosophila bipectinata]